MTTNDQRAAVGQWPTVAALRERVQARRRVRTALGCDGKSARAAVIDDDARRELANAHGRESRARASTRRERIASRSRSDRQLVIAAVIPCLNLEHLAHPDQLAALAAILSRPNESEGT